MKKVFIGGVAAMTTEDDVRAYFSQYGTVSSGLSGLSKSDLCVCVYVR